MSNAKRISLAVLLLLSGATFTNAQSGHGDIEGTVTDALTGQTLVGVNVTIEGTSIGAAADLDGYYILRRLPAGDHVLVFSYIGYETSRTPVEVRNGVTLEVDMAMTEERLVGDEVTISAQRQGQQQAINRQITSDHIVNVVSEARLQELPDFNAAAALSRLPGISTQKSSGEDNKVVIRGLSPKYNAVEVEGVRLSSTGSTQIGLSSNPDQGNPTVSNDRSVDLTTVSPYMIRMISLYKALTPDMNANSIGGTVNMELREAPRGPRGSLLVQGGYTAKSSTYGNYRAIASGSNRFFNDKLGAYAFLISESYDRDADNLDATYGIRADAVEQDPGTGFRPVQVNDVTFNRHLETRDRYGANLILDYTLPSGSLKFINMYTRLNSDYTDHKQTIEYDTGRMNWNLRLGETAIDQQLHTLKLDYDLRFVTADLSASYASSSNVLDGSPSLNFNQVDAIQVQPRDNVVPEDLTFLVDFRGNDQVVLRSADLFSSDYQEDRWTFKADFEVPFNLGTSASGFFKFGGQHDDQSNATDQETPYVSFGQGGNMGIQGNMMRGIEQEFGYTLNAQGDLAGSLFLNSDNDLYDPFLSDRFGDIFYSASPNQLTEILDFIIGNPDYDASNTQQSSGAQGGWYDGPYQRLTNDYEYDEKYYATYAMSKINFRNLMIIGGARYEKVDFDYFAYNARDQRNAQAQRMYDTTATESVDHLLPMGQMRYSPFKWMDVRYAYTQTLARPDYHQLSPKFTVTQDNRLYTGNADLKPAKAFNHDVSVSFHSNKLGLLSAGAFHKKIDGFVYNATYQLDAAERAGIDSLAHYTIIRNGNPVVIPQSNAIVQRPLNNPHEATVKGLEFEFQHNFWYAPGLLSNIVFGANYTYVESETTYPFYDVEVVLVGRDRIAMLVDSSRTGRLIDQANDIVNTFVGYDYKGFSARLSFTYQGNSVTNIGGEFPERDGFTRDYFRVDLSARQKLPLANSELFLDVQNLNDENTESAQRTIGGFNGIQNYGTTANLGIRLTL